MNRSWRAPGIAAVCLSAILSTQARAEVQIGAVLQPEYKGAIGQLPTGTEHQLIFSEPVYAEETVLTDAQASTALQFLDRTQLRVGKNSTVKLDKFIYDPGTGSGEAALNFGVGAFRYVSGSLGKTRNVQLVTPTAVLSIRGTDLVIAVAADGTTQVAVLDGEIEVTPCGGDAALARMGETATVPADCSGVSVTVGLTVPEDPTLFAELNDIAPAAGPAPEPHDELSDQDRDQTASTGSTPDPEPEPEPEPDDTSSGGGFLGGLGNLGRIGEGLGRGFGRVGDHFSGDDD